MANTEQLLQSLADSLEKTQATVAICGLAIFGYAWSAHLGFFGQLDLHPTDAGLGFADVLYRAAIATALMAALISFAGFIGYALAKAIDSNIAGLGALIAAPVPLVLLLLDGSHELRLLAAFGAYLLVLLLLLLASHPTRGRTVRAPLFAVAMLVIIGGVAIAYHSGGAAAAEMLTASRASLLRSDPVWGFFPRDPLRIVAWTPTSVNVIPTDGFDPRAGTHHEGMVAGYALLGEADGRLVVWDFCRHITRRIPSGAVSIDHRGFPDPITEQRQNAGGSTPGGGVSCGRGGGI